MFTLMVMPVIPSWAACSNADFAGRFYLGYHPCHHRLFNSVTINYDGMMLLALLGVVVNFWPPIMRGRRFTNAVNLHMMEDVGMAVWRCGRVLPD